MSKVYRLLVALLSSNQAEAIAFDLKVEEVDSFKAVVDSRAKVVGEVYFEGSVKGGITVD